MGMAKFGQSQATGRPSKASQIARFTRPTLGPPGADRTQGHYSLSGKTSYHKISWSLEAARFGFKRFQSLLPRCLSNFRAIQLLQHPISRLRDFGGKTSYRVVNRGPGEPHIGPMGLPIRDEPCEYLLGYLSNKITKYTNALTHQIDSEGYDISMVTFWLGSSTNDGISTPHNYRDICFQTPFTTGLNLCNGRE